jgi:LysM repeat protein
MAGITVDDLMDFGPLQSQQQDSWAKFLAGVEQNADFLQSKVKQPIGQAWSGTAAELANDKVDTTHGGLIASAQELAGIHSTLVDFNTTMSGYASQMKAAVEGATGMVVYPDGTVDYRVAGTWTSAQLTKLHNTQTHIQGILAKANELDTRTQQKLLSYMPKQPAAFVAPKAPAAVGKWTTVSTEGSLWQIAQKEYGDGSKWQLIYDANRSTIGSNPNLIYAGMKLKIPPLAGSAGTAAGAQTSAVAGPVTSPGTSSTTGAHTTSDQPAPSSSPSAGAGYGDSTTAPPGVSQAEWGVS